jgi:hypothetical protein
VADVIGGWSIWDHYANAFSAREGSCWRRVYEGDGTGRPMSCPEPVEWRGRYRTRRGKWFVVDSCEGDVDDELVGMRRVIQPSIGVRSAPQ